MNRPEYINKRNSHRKLVRKLVLLAVGMFGFGFALWPLYSVFCDLTGLGGRGVQVVENVGVIEQSDRQIKIRFDANVNSSLPWTFEAKEKTAIVSLGKMNEALYLAMNPTANSTGSQPVFCQNRVLLLYPAGIAGQ
jgi:cytochrome c oxidase assembly protein subunit 11